MLSPLFFHVKILPFTNQYQSNFKVLYIFFIVTLYYPDKQKCRLGTEDTVSSVPFHKILLICCFFNLLVAEIQTNICAYHNYVRNIEPECKIKRLCETFWSDTAKISKQYKAHEKQALTFCWSWTVWSDNRKRPGNTKTYNHQRFQNTC